jgi:hypothetical protein
MPTDWNAKTRGELVEQQLKPTIAQHLGYNPEQLIKQGDFDMIDFIINDDIYIEIKERLARSDTFADAMFPFHKFNYCLAKAMEGKTVYLYFKYFDCTMFYRFHPNSDRDFNFREGGRNNGEETRWYSYLKSEHLTRLHIDH